MLRDLVLQNRSYRRFYNEFFIDLSILKELANLARLSPSTRNLQPLKYLIFNEKEKNALIFPTLHWAGYLKQGGIEIAEEERPSAYIIMLGDVEICPHFNVDSGIASQSILLGACEKGLGGCLIATIEHERLKKSLGISDRYETLLVIALGKPKETVVIEPMQNENVKYWRDEKQIHHVPKRSLDEIILNG
jgi:nitroreductase